LEDHDVRDYVALTAFGADTGPLLVASDEGDDAIHPPVSRPEQNPS
jgi:hypothetical protein